MKTQNVMGQSGTEYPFSFGTNSMCRAEKIIGAPIGVIFSTLSTGQPPMVLLRQFVQATLALTPAPTEDEVGDIIDDLGGMAATMVLMTGAMVKAQPKVPIADPEGVPVPEAPSADGVAAEVVEEQVH